ncbi:MAG: 20-beta-hydroxysteroid dehydrogenase [Hyphomicrobiales bacterium]|nr:MAG: 20-beta-hydroxysteroid dehydrogenase [Hyphomicrobiales bacterium]
MKTALITGGARGIGAAISESLLKNHKMQIVVWGRNEDDLQKLKKNLSDFGTIHIKSVDVGDKASLDAGLAWLEAEGLKIDVLVNNAGTNADDKLLLMEDDTILNHIMVNAMAPLRLIRALSPGMIERGYGRIANLSSAWGSFHEGLGPAAYGITKAFLNAITITSAAELPECVKVNSVCPGWVQTSMGGPDAPKTPAEGADTPVWLTTLPENGPTGGFFRERKPINW